MNTGWKSPAYPYMGWSYDALGWHISGSGLLHVKPSSAPPPPPSTCSPAPVILNWISKPLVSSLITSGVVALKSPTNLVTPLQAVFVSKLSFVKTALITPWFEPLEIVLW